MKTGRFHDFSGKYNATSTAEKYLKEHIKVISVDEKYLGKPKSAQQRRKRDRQNSKCTYTRSVVRVAHRNL